MESHRFAICVMQYLNFLRITVKDHFNLVSEKLLGLASSYSFGKFGKIPRQQVSLITEPFLISYVSWGGVFFSTLFIPQIIWLLETLCDNSIQPFHKTLVFLIRQIKGTRFIQKWHRRPAYQVLKPVTSLRTRLIWLLVSSEYCTGTGRRSSWLSGSMNWRLTVTRERLPSQSLELFHLAVYSFLRMIPEHTTVPQLCRSEIEFVIYSLHKKVRFTHVYHIQMPKTTSV